MLNETSESRDIPMQKRCRMTWMAAGEFDERKRERVPAQVSVARVGPVGVETRECDVGENLGKHARGAAYVAPDEDVPGALDAPDDLRDVECLEEFEEFRPDRAAEGALVGGHADHDEARPYAGNHPADPGDESVRALGAASPVPRVPAEKDGTTLAGAVPGASERNEPPSIEGRDGGVILVGNDGENAGLIRR